MVLILIFHFQAEQKLVVDKHNALRRQIAKGLETRGANGSGPQPIAADMYELVWDSVLTASAQRFALIQNNFIFAEYSRGKISGVNFWKKGVPVTRLFFKFFW